MEVPLMLVRKPVGVLIAAIVLAIGAFATTTAASAAVFTLTNTECLGGTTIALCYQGKDPAGTTGSWEFEGEQSVTMRGGTTRVTVPSLEGLEVRCTESVSTGLPVFLQHEPLANGLTTIEEGALVFIGCLPTNPASFQANCVLPAASQTVNLLDELESETDVVLTPESGTIFITFEVKSKESLKCAAAFLGQLHIRGTQLLTFLNPGVPELTKTAVAELKSGLLYGEENLVELEKEGTISFTGLEDLVYVSKIS
jgi:hypothetical protein